MKLHVLNKRAFLISLFFFLIFSALVVGGLFLQIKRIRQDQVIELNRKFLNFQNRTDNFMTFHSTLLYGFSAYINVFDVYNEEDVYRYLEELLKDQEYIRNVGILKDTTIIWNYPREDNASAIGVDLSKIESQAPIINKVKTQLVPVFQGPVNLVQGGVGYIIRIPILKNNQFWGMASIVLKGDKFREFLDDNAQKSGVHVAILNQEMDDVLMYGSMDKQCPQSQTYSLDTSFGKWKFLVSPVENNNKRFFTIILITLISSVVFFLPLTILIYLFLRKSFDVNEMNALLKKTAAVDKLTGIYNRSALEKYIMREVSLSESNSSPLSILIFDLDHFKQVNDEYGHEEGDAVLIETVNLIKQNIRKSDFFARWGGEEFIIVMPETLLGEAIIAAEKIRNAKACFKHGKVGFVTISIGLAQRFKNEYWGSLFKRIDTALYNAKENGRNQVSISAHVDPFFDTSKDQQWRKEWNSGNEVIDSQHKKIFDDGNILLHQVKGNKEDFLKSFDTLCLDIREHFESEEMILRDCGYPFLKDHIEIHEHLKNGLKKLKEQIIAGKLNPADSIQFMVDDLIAGHLIQEDLKFFNYLHK